MFLEKIVIGSTAESALYALLTESYFISTRKIPYLFFENLPFSIMGLNSYPELWSRLNLMLGLLGKKVSIKGDSLIKIDDEKIKFSSTVVEIHNFNGIICYVSIYRTFTYYIGR